MPQLLRMVESGCVLSLSYLTFGTKYSAVIPGQNSGIIGEKHEGKDLFQKAPAHDKILAAWGIDKKSFTALHAEVSGRNPERVV